MALYWPEKKVALQIDDDPRAEPFDGPDDWTVIHTNCKEMSDYGSMNAVIGKVYAAMGLEMPTDYDNTRQRFLFELLQDGLDEDPDPYSPRNRYQGDAKETLDLSNWKGPIPDGSLRNMGDGRTMSTPEFHFLRKASQLKLTQLVQLGMELCGLYGTDHLEDPRNYTLYEGPVTDVPAMRQYLRGARRCKGYREAMRALNYVAEGSSSPMATYITLLLTLPKNYGGYDMFRPQLSVCLDGHAMGLGTAPAEDGPYEHYDLCWPRYHTAVQFVGDTRPTPRELRALTSPDVGDMYVVCLTMDEVADEEAFDQAARLIAQKIGFEPPRDTAAFAAARDRLRQDLVFPDFDNMRSTSEDMHCHELA